ncbi:hypothetical protein ACFYNX_26395 [Streptomyces sp. NPDC007872]|uniref:hypothetical protein n=1 Tax=Streptomyces sp. NPDC007872 TaxID=3364782 RepID=UPI00368D119E
MTQTIHRKEQSMKPSQITAFQTVLSRLATAGFRCTVESDETTTDESWAVYHFADGSNLIWGTTSETGAENSVTHLVSAHRALDALFTNDYGDEPQLFATGDFDEDVNALRDWIAYLTETHGTSQE